MKPRDSGTGSNARSRARAVCQCLPLVFLAVALMGQQGPCPPTGPSIASVTPNPAAPGEPVTVAGSGFGPVEGNNQVLYDGAPLAVTSWSDTSIGAALPNPKPDGTYDVQAVVDGTPSNVVQHTIGSGAGGSTWNSMVWNQGTWGGGQGP